MKAKATKKKATKSMNMPKFREILKDHGAQHKSWKKDIKEAIKNGEHKAAGSAIKMLHKSKDALNKMVEHVSGHADKKRPKI